MFSELGLLEDEPIPPILLDWLFAPMLLPLDSELEEAELVMSSP